MNNINNISNMSNTKNTGNTKPERMKINRTDIDGGLDAMFPTADPTPTKHQKTTTKDGRKQITFKLPVAVVEKLRALAYWERREQWQIVVRSLEREIEEYEKTNGEIKPIPEE